MSVNCNDLKFFNSSIDNRVTWVSCVQPSDWFLWATGVTHLWSQYINGHYWQGIFRNQNFVIFKVSIYWLQNLFYYTGGLIK